MNDYQQRLQQIGDDAEQWELRYRQAAARKEAPDFAQAVIDMHQAEPEDLFYAAWYYRLRDLAQTTTERVIAWSWAIPLALLNGLLLWFLSDMDRFYLTVGEGNHMPLFVLLWAPLSALLVMSFLVGAGNRQGKRAAAVGAAVVALAGYSLLFYRQAGGATYQSQYLILMAVHLPLLAWASVGTLLLSRHDDTANRFAFLSKSLEVALMAGLFAIAGGLFTTISLGMFQTLGIEPTETLVRLFFAGGGGLITVLAVAAIYDPTRSPARQSFSAGLSKLVALLMHLLLPLSLLVLLIYLGLVPTHFRQPFENRNVLITYNGMMFAVVLLLLGGTPRQRQDVSPRLQSWLRRGILLLTLLAIVAGVYALVAILWRTTHNHLTPNRLTFIGWNIINLGLLASLLLKQIRQPQGDWVQALHEIFGKGASVYLAWTLFTILATPWLFGSGLVGGRVVNMPAQLQSYIGDDIAPVLVKCDNSPHIYAIEQDGQKHWIKDIPTFESRGDTWERVQFVPCDKLRTVPDGVPIPPDAGTPPQP
ncbi:MAG: hypothetical protein GXP37_06425 [Chloroflexi bacterium]|nr:hypothetical protein [Chloroflexota bacterium]